MIGGSTRGRQKGIALIAAVALFATAFTWFVVDSATKIQGQTAAREAKTGAALKAAKEAVLAHVARTAADTSELYPGRLPCPEVRSQIGTVNEGMAGPFSAPVVACDAVGRLPWKTLGIDQIVDGAGELLWYAVPTGTWAWVNSNDALTINPGLANQLCFDDSTCANRVVAVIVAPGSPLNTTPEAATPPAGCAKVTQTRSAVSLAVANYLECGNASGSYGTIGTAPWSNDRAIAITAREVMDAIAGSVQNRIQRQVAPALETWRSTSSTAAWGRSFLPYASAFDTAPASNPMCGDSGVHEGLLATARSASSTCTNWTGGSVAATGGLVVFPVCTPGVSRIRCTFNGTGTGLFGVLTVNVTVTTAAGAQAFRAALTSGDVTTSHGTVQSVTNSLSAGGVATTVVRIQTAFLYVATSFTVDIDNLADHTILTDTAMAWFLNNQWDRYTYFQMSTAAAANPVGTCPTGGGSQCLTVNNLPSSTGLTNNKRFVLTLAGNALSTQTQPSATLSNYLEGHSASTTTYTADRVSSTFNDRMAACPYQNTNAASAVVTICN